MENGSGHFGFAPNLSLNAFGSGSKGPFGAAYDSADITLRLDSPGNSIFFGSISTGTKRKWGDVYEIDVPEHPALALGLGRPSSSSDNSKGSSATACTMSSAKETTDEESSVDLELNFQLHICNENTFSSSKKQSNLEASETDPLLQLTLSTGQSESSIITNVAPVRIIDEAATMTDSLRSPVTGTSGITHPQQQQRTTKNCLFQGCGKGARGASGLCIAHGGGRRCRKASCHKGAEGRTAYCKGHGGGRRCQFLGCTRSAEGRTEYCISHGGGRRCNHDSCTRAARGKSGLCIRHGGGKRCQMDNCTKSAEGYSGLCISHGGGRRCQFLLCTKGAQGSTMFCKAHGGGKRCTVVGCTKGAEGSTAFCKGHGGGKRCSFQGDRVCPKSVHGGTQFCVAHGGGKRCAVSECTKSARGRTDYCVRHGGGKRCKSEGCGKSAQGSTDFCKAHGGGKRCSWSEGPPCDRFARGKTGLCAAHSASVQDRCVHGGGTLRPNPERLKEVIRGEMFSTMECDAVPNKSMNPVTAPEGRVHGGNLMEILSKSAVAGSQTGTHGEVGTSKQTPFPHWM